jgi:predicted secreted protein
LNSSRPVRRGVALLAALGVAGCAQLGMPAYSPIIPRGLPAPRVVTEAVDGSTVDIVRTQMISVRLPADSQGDKRWTFELGKERVLYPAGFTPRFEDAQTEVFTFRAEASGTTSVRFIYRDPAQPQTPPARTVAFEVVAH